MTVASDLFYVSKAGDVLDEILLRHYGAGAEGHLAAVLVANPGVAKHGAVLPAGVAITLPARASDPVQTEGRLWD